MLIGSICNSSPECSKTKSVVYADETASAKTLGWQEAWCIKR